MSSNDRESPRYSPEELLPQVYEELRRLADARIASEFGDQTLQATALVHEAYLKLVGEDRQTEPDCQDATFVPW